MNFAGRCRSEPASNYAGKTGVFKRSPFLSEIRRLWAVKATFFFPNGFADRSGAGCPWMRYRTRTVNACVAGQVVHRCCRRYAKTILLVTVPLAHSHGVQQMQNALSPCSFIRSKVAGQMPKCAMTEFRQSGPSPWCSYDCLHVSERRSGSVSLKRLIMELERLNGYTDGFEIDSQL